MATRLIVELAGARWTGATDVQHGCRAGGDPLRPERTDAVLGLEVAAGEQSAILTKARLRAGQRRLPRPHVAGARRHARDRPRRGGRALQDGGDSVHAAGARRDVRRLTRWQRLRRLVEDVLTGCGFSEAYTSTFVAEAICGSLSRSPWKQPLCAPRCSRAWSTQRITTCPSARRRSRCSRSRAPTTPAASCRRALACRGIVRRRLSGREVGGRAALRGAEARRVYERRIGAALHRGSRRARPRAGWASCTRRSSRGSGGLSSSISTHSSPPLRKRLSSRP